MNKSLKIDLPKYNAKSGWLFAPSTYLVDSWVPEVEKIMLPPCETINGHLSLYLSDKKLIENKNLNNMPFVKRLVFDKNPLDLEYKTLIDLRVRDPENIAHSITNHLPLALLAKEFINSDDSFTLLLPSKIPLYIEKIFSEIGFEVIKSDSNFLAKSCGYDMTPWQSIRGIRHQVIQQRLTDSLFAKKISKLSKGLPRKVFLSRRGNRVLSNEKKVEEYLETKGFIKIYAEDFDVLTQISMLTHASHIVAVHGAALGPLLLRAMYPASNLKLVELFNPGHMTNVYRIICDQLKVEWVGVRGKLWPSIVQQAYEQPLDPRKYSLSNFEVCLKSLDEAMNHINA